MKIVLFGATGPTGQVLLPQALELGHAVTALARRPEAIPSTHERLKVVKGDILDIESVEAAVAGQEAVVSVLGVRILKKNTILSDGTKNILNAMKKQGVRRFICMTSLGVGDSKDQPAWIFSWIIRPLFLRNVFIDKEVQEKYVKESGLDWIIVRPAGLTNGPRTRVYQHWIGPPPRPITSRISCADAAEFTLKQLSDDTYLRKTPGLSY